MQYKIDYLDARGLVGSKTHNGSLSNAQTIAEKAIADKLADAVEIRDANGTLVFCRPKTMNRG